MVICKMNSSATGLEPLCDILKQDPAVFCLACVVVCIYKWWHLTGFSPKKRKKKKKKEKKDAGII